MGSAAAVGAGAEGCSAVPRAVMPPSPPSLSHFPITFGSTFAHSFSKKLFRLSLKIFFEFFRGTRSCGRFGPAREGSTSLRFRVSVSVKTGSGASFVRKRPCFLQ